jgi:hypothetical protein
MNSEHTTDRGRGGNRLEPRSLAETQREEEFAEKTESGKGAWGNLKRARSTVRREIATMYRNMTRTGFRLVLRFRENWYHRDTENTFTDSR